jgi:hypothetical protein
MPQALPRPGAGEKYRYENSHVPQINNSMAFMLLQTHKVDDRALI